MSHRKIIDNYVVDINNIAELLTKLVNNYRLLVGSADELNKIALSKKSEVKDALKRADELGDIIDDIIKVLDDFGYNYINYCKLKSQVLESKMNIQFIEAEIDEELRLQE